MTRLAALVVGLVLAAPLAVAARVVVRLAPDATVSRDEITLAEVAAVQGAEPLAGRLRGLRVGPAPAAGVTTRLDAETLRARLRQAHVDLAQVDIVGDRVVVTRAFQIVPGSALVDAVRQRAVARLQRGTTPDSALALIPVSVPDDLRAPPGDLALAVRLPDVPPGSAFISASVTITIDGRDYQTVPLAFRVGRWQAVVVAVQALDPSRALSPSDVRVESRASTEVPPDALGDLGDTRDLEVARPVRAGEVLTARTLRPRLLVRRNELVTLVLEGHGFRITAQGQARADARRGDSVPVLNVTSKREVLGLVEAPGVVRVPLAHLRVRERIAASPGDSFDGPRSQR